MNNATFLDIDRTTHVKIVVLALIASTMVGIGGICAHLSSSNIAAGVQLPAKSIATALQASPNPQL